MAELEQEEMSFWDHLEALRWTLFRSFLALFIFAIGSFAFMRGSDGIFDRVVLAPCYSDFIFYRWLCDLNQWLVNVSPWFDVLPDFCNDIFLLVLIQSRTDELPDFPHQIRESKHKCQPERGGHVSKELRC